MEFFTSTAFELPCVFTTSPFKPKSGAPPYWLASKDLSVSVGDAVEAIKSALN